MARPLRIEFPDAVYHLMSRGIDGRSIVRDDDDREAWLRCLHRSVKDLGWRLDAYALMDNHYHCAGYCRRRDALPWADYRVVLGEFGRNEVKARAAYRRYLLDEMTSDGVAVEQDDYIEHQYGLSSRRTSACRQKE